MTTGQWRMCTQRPGVMARTRRARTEQEKADRSAGLIASARELLAREEYAAVSVQAIAARAGVAKGTVFLYYPTKEALGLSVLRALLAEWWDDLDERLGALERPASPSTVAAAARRSLERRTELIRLVGMMEVVLEANAGRDAVAEFRRHLLEGAGRLGSRLETALDFLRRGEGLEVALTLHAILIGINQMAPPLRRDALEGTGLAPFRVDVPGAVGRTLRIQLEGARAVARMGAAPA